MHGSFTAALDIIAVMWMFIFFSTLNFKSCPPLFLILQNFLEEKIKPLWPKGWMFKRLFTYLVFDRRILNFLSKISAAFL